ncbi:3882_t:CDS:2 [Ambispora gerdemannii]|uniref:3882_t:CDS:1 n=1 Tax=Ambispora gerdemannii TaxID=144530 RepID=A0A9N9F2A1_9GLOM|nr:3882_t:CDS:2 [Ambispora gerdemannii]
MNNLEDKEFEDIDYYDFLGVNYNSTLEDIEKAYRKKARKHHPDKNRENPEAATKIFHQVSKVFELLSDPIKKLEYDNARKARVAAKKRYEALDAKRKVMKEDLEENERVARQKKQQRTYSEESEQVKVERLRAETAQRRQQLAEKLHRRAAEFKASK